MTNTSSIIVDTSTVAGCMRALGLENYPAISVDRSVGFEFFRRNDFYFRGYQSQGPSRYVLAKALQDSENPKRNSRGLVNFHAMPKENLPCMHFYQQFNTRRLDSPFDIEDAAGIADLLAVQARGVACYEAHFGDLVAYAWKSIAGGTMSEVNNVSPIKVPNCKVPCIFRDHGIIDEVVLEWRDCIPNPDDGHVGGW